MIGIIGIIIAIIILVIGAILMPVDNDLFG